MLENSVFPWISALLRVCTQLPLYTHMSNESLLSLVLLPLWRIARLRARDCVQGQFRSFKTCPLVPGPNFSGTRHFWSPRPIKHRPNMSLPNRLTELKVKHDEYRSPMLGHCFVQSCGELGKVVFVRVLRIGSGQNDKIRCSRNFVSVTTF